MPTSSFGKIFVVSGEDAERLIEYINDPNTGIKIDPNFKSNIATKEDIERLRELFAKSNENIAG